MFVLLGTVSGTASIANILTLPESTRDMGCCKEIGSFPCAAAMLGIVQIGVQWSWSRSTVERTTDSNNQQYATLSHLLPSRLLTRRRRRTGYRHAHMERSSARSGCVARLLRRCIHRLRRLRIRASFTRSRMGQLPRLACHGPRCNTVHPSDLHDMETARNWQLVYSHDVHTNTGELRLCSQSLCEAGTWGLECMGPVHLYGYPARLLASHGPLFCLERQKGPEKPATRRC